MLFIIIIFILFLILTYIYINFYIGNLIGSIVAEDFKNESEVINIKSNRNKYIEYGIINFFTRENNIDIVKNNENKYIYIYPNNIDVMCSATNITKSTDDVCKDASIIKSFKVDKLPLYTNENKPNYVLSLPISNENNFKLRVFDNVYNMTRRSILLEIESIVAFNEKNLVGSNKISVSGNIKAFILSRPFFITINDFGIYKIVYDSVVIGGKETNSFVYYNSNDKIHTFYITKIDDSSVFPNTSSLISDYYENLNIVHRVTNKTPITIYYLIYSNNIVLEKKHDLNSFYIHLNNIDIEKNNIINSLTTIDLNDSQSSDRIKNIQLIQENTHSLKILFNLISLKFYKDLPVDFNPGNYVKYDIILTFSLDILTIVCIGKDKLNKEECFVERYFNPSNAIIETQMDKLNNISIRSGNIPKTAIPYVPEVLVKRGYTLA